MLYGLYRERSRTWEEDAETGGYEGHPLQQPTSLCSTSAVYLRGEVHRSGCIYMKDQYGWSVCPTHACSCHAINMALMIITRISCYSKADAPVIRNRDKLGAMAVGLETPTL